MTILASGAVPAPTRGSIITLVHGTWGRNTSFIQPDSELRKTLREHVPGPVGFLRFQWSGWNMHSARRKACKDLAAFLQAAFTKYPDYWHVVVCHSHGGNVALYALRELRFDQRCWRPLCCICVGTPFLAGTADRLTTAVCDALLGLRSLYGPDSSPYWQQAHLITYAGLLFLSFAINGDGLSFLWLFFVFVAAYWILFLAMTAAAKAALRNLSSLAIYEVPFPLFCLSMEHDEPTRALGLLSLVFRSLRGVLNALRATLATVGAILLAVGLTGGALSSGLALLSDRLGLAWESIGDVAWTMGEIMAAGSACFILLLVLESAFSLIAHLLGSHSLGFGFDGWQEGWFIHYAISRRPPGQAVYCCTWTLREIAAELKIRTPLVLQHSLLYRTPSVIRAMAAFIRDHSKPGHPSRDNSFDGPL